MTSLTEVAAFRLGRRRGHAHAVWAPAGVPVTVASSWPLGVALTAWAMADALLPDAVPGRSAGAYAATALAPAAALASALPFGRRDRGQRAAGSRSVTRAPA